VGGVADAAVGTVVQHGLDDLVLAAVAAGADGPLALTRAAQLVDRGRLDGAALAKVVTMEAGGRLTPTQAKTVLAEVVSSGGDPEEIANARGFEAMAGDVVAAAVDAAIGAHPGEWERYTRGEAKLGGFFVGKVMAATKGKADGKAVTALLRERAGN
jgi:Asp-tRNA(Asn)/Glu-tRNA(Gln) amidotransferase B subunit